MRRFVVHSATVRISTSSRAVGRLLCALVSVIAGIGLAAANSSAQTNSTLLYAASAYGTYATVGNVVTVGKTAPVMISTQCGTAQVGVSKTGTSASVSDPPLLSTGVTNTSASSALNVATSSSTVASLSLLSGLVTASAVTAVSTTSVNSEGAFEESGTGSNFTNLVIAGIPFIGTPAPNTTVPLLGFGSVVLNQQTIVQTATSAHLTVNMIDISITVTNILGIPVGTQIIVADAYSSLLEVRSPAALGGEAYGTQIIGQLVTSSPTAPAIEPCTGTGGRTVTKTLAGVTIPLVLSSGTITDTAEGTATSAGANGETSDTIQGVNLLSGVVTADVISDQANGSTSDGIHLTLTTSGSFTNIVVLGQPGINDNVPPNTRVPLAGFGTLWLHRIVTTADSIEIRMLEIQITEENVLGLPIGADIRVGDSSIALLSASD
jgi:hypothetical protein